MTNTREGERDRLNIQIIKYDPPPPQTFLLKFSFLSLPATRVSFHNLSGTTQNATDE
jgi:hypothetical protein